MKMSLFDLFRRKLDYKKYREIETYVRYNYYAVTPDGKRILSKHGIWRYVEDGDRGFNIYSVIFKNIKLYQGIRFKGEEDYVLIYTELGGLDLYPEDACRVEFDKEFDELLESYQMAKDEIETWFNNKKEREDKERREIYREAVDGLNRKYK